MSNTKKYDKIFDYLSTSVSPSESKGLLVFGRKDLLVARKVVDLTKAQFAKYVVITGGIGKDSGGLGIPEAEYIAQGVEGISKSVGVTLPPPLYRDPSNKWSRKRTQQLGTYAKSKIAF